MRKGVIVTAVAVGFGVAFRHRRNKTRADQSLATNDDEFDQALSSILAGTNVLFQNFPPDGYDWGSGGGGGSGRPGDTSGSPDTGIGW